MVLRVVSSSLRFLISACRNVVCGSLCFDGLGGGDDGCIGDFFCGWNVLCFGGGFDCWVGGEAMIRDIATVMISPDVFPLIFSGFTLTCRLIFAPSLVWTSKVKCVRCFPMSCWMLRSMMFFREAGVINERSSRGVPTMVSLVVPRRLQNCWLMSVISPFVLVCSWGGNEVCCFVF